jgi:hypothetical protein
MRCLDLIWDTSRICLTLRFDTWISWRGLVITNTVYWRTRISNSPLSCLLLLLIQLLHLIKTIIQIRTLSILNGLYLLATTIALSYSTRRWFALTRIRSHLTNRSTANLSIVLDLSSHSLLWNIWTNSWLHQFLFFNNLILTCNGFLSSF